MTDVLWEKNPLGINYASKYVGEPDVPQEIKRKRRQVYDAMRRMGSPVLVKHMYNTQDVEDGIAEESLNFSSIYGQTRNRDNLSHGVGYVSVEKSDDEWISPNGDIVVSSSQPSGNHIQAPKYRGFGPGYLIWMIQPDVVEDMFKVDPTGVLIQVQNATAQAPWFPEINDNDLIIDIELNENWEIISSFERYQAKMTNPITIRGFGDRMGRRTSPNNKNRSNRWMINQHFEMSAILESTNSELYNVEIDR